MLNKLLLPAFLSLLLVAIPIRGLAAELSSPSNTGFSDGIDRADPNFVTASLLVMSPGNLLYSSMGHSCIRLECPTFNLDYCFSYESESAKGRMLSLLAGNLKMGMFAVKTQDYLKDFSDEGRGVVQYRLNLPPQSKQKLWKMLDEKVTEGTQIPYDVLRRGCAQSIFLTLRDSLAPIQMNVRGWPEKYAKTRRELVESVVNDSLWTRLFLHTLSGMELDRDVSKSEKVVVPNDLVEILQRTWIGDKPIISEVGVELLPTQTVGKKCGLTPIMLSSLMVVAAVLNMFVKIPLIDGVFLLFQTVFGLALAYLVFVSTLFGTNWNWLIVPFNILPFIFWKWRQKWALWFASLLVVWEAFMIFHPHRLTDPAYLVLVAAYIVMFAKIGWQGRAHRPVTVTKPVSRGVADIFEQLSPCQCGSGS